MTIYCRACNLGAHNSCEPSTGHGAECECECRAPLTNQERHALRELIATTPWQDR